MKKLILSCVLIAFVVACTNHTYGEDYKKFEIKQGMHEDIVNGKYGQPVLTEKLESGFLPIPKKKALYKIGNSMYMILHFFSGRINEITMLEDVNSEKAVSLFKEN